jgi:hypothetical protein
MELKQRMAPEGSPLAALAQQGVEAVNQPNSKNDNSQKRDDVLPIWSDALPQLSIRQFLIII